MASSKYNHIFLVIHSRISFLLQKNHRKHTNNKDINESVTSSASTSSDTDKNEDEATQTSSSEPDQNNNNNQPYEVANSKVMGRYLVTSRDLKAGEVVIKEKPIVIGPCGEPVCLGCYIPIPTRSNQYKLVLTTLKTVGKEN